MLRIAGVFMVLLLVVICNAFGNGADSAKANLVSGVEQEANTNPNEEREDDRENSKNNINELQGRSFDEANNGVLGSDFWNAIGTGIIALFTIVLARTSWLQWKAIGRANEVAREAANSTKRSVDAYVGRERGRLVLKSLKRSSSKGGNGFEYQFVNAGPTGVVVHGFNCTVVQELVRENGAISIDPVDDLSLIAVSYYVKPGGCFGFQNSDEDLIPAKIGIDYMSQEIAAHDLNPDNNIVAVFDFSYETSFGTYNKRHVAAFADFGHIGFPDGDLSYDLPRAEWLENYGVKE